MDNIVNYMVRAKPGQRDRVIKSAEALLREIDADRIVSTKTLSQARIDAYRGDHGMVILLSSVCAALLVITAFGIVGLTSYWVSQRRRQIGIRRALGATRQAILRYFQTENLLIAAAGSFLGVVGAIGLNLWMVRSFEAVRMDSSRPLVGAFIMLGLGQLAVLYPALRAAAIPLHWRRGAVSIATMRTVLVIDDNAAVAQALTVLFSLHDIRTLSALTPEKGLAVAARERVDLVIADMNFSADTTSGEEGEALFRALRAQSPDLPVVLLTAWTHLQSAVQLVKAGAADYIGKPWENDKLLATVENLLELGEANRERRRLAEERRLRRERLTEQFDLCGIVLLRMPCSGQWSLRAASRDRT